MKVQNICPWLPRMVPAGAALLAHALAARNRKEEGGIAFLIASSVGAIFLSVGTWVLLPWLAVAPMWAACMLPLVLAGRFGNLSPPLEGK
jgi:hypothetical protein